MDVKERRKRAGKSSANQGASPKVLDYVIVIGASAGGVEALISLVKNIPAPFPAPILILQHRSSDQPSLLAELLAKSARLPVVRGIEGQPIHPGMIIVAEPGNHMKIQDNRISLDDGPSVCHVKPAADVLFSSAAKYFGKRVIGVILTGSGHDGTEGCRNIKKAGGLTIAQDEESSIFFQMPGSAIRAQCIDYVLPLNDIAAKLVEITREESHGRH